MVPKSMADTVVVVESAPSPATPPSAPSAPDAPSDAIVGVIHDDARDLGYALARIAEHDNAIAELRAEIVILADNDAAQASATAAIVDSVEEIATEVESMEPGDQLESDPEPEPEDTAPGKTHWFERSAKEWAGRH